nr:Protein R144.3, isoform b [Haemonchus contortus]
MECYNIFSPSTSRSVNLRKRRRSGGLSGNDEVFGVVNVVPSSMEVPIGLNVDQQAVIEDHRRDEPHAYVSEVARRYAEKLRKSKERSLQSDFENESTAVPLIKQRLRRLIGECDIERTTCCVPMCGRVFSSVQVLAWHMSYSHHDLGLQSTYGNLCFVCGVRMDSVKGKTIHLMGRHKDLSVSHNEQCMHQRLPVISPLAPAALRLMQFADERVGDRDLYVEAAYNGYSESSSNGHIAGDDGVELAINT